MSRNAKIVDAMQGLTLRGFGALCAVETPTIIASTNGQPSAAPTSDPPWVAQDDGLVLSVDFSRLR